jgi:hypothetical protein
MSFLVRFRHDPDVEKLDFFAKYDPETNKEAKPDWEKFRLAWKWSDSNSAATIMKTNCLHENRNFVV